jgi:Fur family ferric uptake transcriptional regulator
LILQICRNLLKYCYANRYSQSDLKISKRQNGPSSVQEIIINVKDQADRASVYRTLDLFERTGVTHRLNTGFKYKVELGEAFIAHHHHLHCLNCGQTTSLPPNPLLETMIDSTAKQDGFSPRSHQLEIYGLCANCQ